MKAAVYKDNQTINLEEIPKPELISSGAIIKVLGSGLCGSDIVKYQKKLVTSGAVLGHEVVGEIVEIKSKTDFKVGEKIALGHHFPCFECRFCRGESYSMCKTFKESNIIPGGFCEYIMVTEEHLKNTVVRIPNNVSLIQASFTEPVACCLRAVKRALVAQGDYVLILGLGSIGILMGQIAKHFGAKVIGCDLSNERVNKAIELGFDEAIKFENNELTSEQIKNMSDIIGVDKVFLTAGADATLSFASLCIRNGGTINVFSSVKNDLSAFANNDIYYKELTVQGSYSPSPQDIHESMEFIKDGIINVDSLTTVYSLENVNDAINDAISGKIFKAFIRIQKDSI